MINFLDDLDARGRRDGMATQLAALVIIVPGIELICARGRTIALWNLDRSNLEIILGLAGCVCAQEETVCGVWFGGRSEMMVIFFLNLLEHGYARFFVGEPLTSQTGPVKSVGDHNIVEIRCIFLPSAIVRFRNVKVRFRESPSFVFLLGMDSMLRDSVHH